MKSIEKMAKEHFIGLTDFILQDLIKAFDEDKVLVDETLYP